MDADEVQIMFGFIAKGIIIAVFCACFFKLILG